MKLKNAEDAVVSCDVARDDSVMLFVSASGHGKRTKLDKFNRQGRGGQGVRGMKITASRVGVVAAFMVAARRRDPRVLVGRQYHSYRSQGHLLPGSRCHRGQGGGARATGESVVAVARVLEADEEGEGS